MTGRRATYVPNLIGPPGTVMHQAWRAKQCHCKPRLANTLLLWFSAVMVVVSILFPEFLANLLAGSS